MIAVAAGGLERDSTYSSVLLTSVSNTHSPAPYPDRGCPQARMEGDKLVFRGLIASPDGKLFYDTTREGKPEDAVEMGNDAGMELKVRRGGRQLFTCSRDRSRSMDPSDLLWSICFPRF